MALTSNATANYMDLGSGQAKDAYLKLNYGSGGEVPWIQFNNDFSFPFDTERVDILGPPAADLSGGPFEITLPAATGTIPSHQTGTSTLTETTATPVLQFPIAQGDFVAGSLTLNTSCDDSTDFLLRRSKHEFVCYNAAGTETCDRTNATATESAIQATSGTLTIVLSSTGGTDTVDLTVSATCSLTQTTLEAFWNVEFEDGYQRIATEQN